MLLVAGGMCYNLQALAATYLRYPVTVSVRLGQNQEQLLFPAVSICNMNPMRKSELAAMEDDDDDDDGEDVRKRRRRKRMVSSGMKSLIASI